MTMYDFNYFEGQDLVRITAPKAPKLPRDGSLQNYDDIITYAESIKEYQKLKEQYQLDLTLFREKKSARLDEFRETLKRDYSLSKSQFDVLWDEAYSRGSSEGLHRIFQEFGDLYYIATKFMEVSK